MVAPAGQHQHLPTIQGTIVGNINARGIDMGQNNGMMMPMNAPSNSGHPPNPSMTISSTDTGANSAHATQSSYRTQERPAELSRQQAEMRGQTKQVSRAMPTENRNMGKGANAAAAQPMSAEEKKKKNAQQAQQIINRLHRQIHEERREQTQSSLKNLLAKEFPSITVPKHKDERRYLPKSRLQSLVSNSCGSHVKLANGTAEALEDIAEQFVADAIQYALGMAKRRKMRKLDSTDIATYFAIAWNLDIPGFGGSVPRTQRHTRISAEQRVRLASARKENFADGKKISSAAKGKAAKAGVTKPTS